MPDPGPATVPSRRRACRARRGAGDERAIGQLYDRYGAVLYAVAYRIVGQRADAEEVVLEAFAQAWREAPRFEAAPRLGGGLAHDDRAEPGARSGAGPEPARPDHRHRRRRPAGHVARRWATSGRIRPRRSITTSGGARCSRRWQTLSPPQRQAIELAYFEGLSQSEIAERLQEPLGTVKTRVRLGMQKLRECLRPFYFERGT